MYNLKRRIFLYNFVLKPKDLYVDAGFVYLSKLLIQLTKTLLDKVDKMGFDENFRLLNSYMTNRYLTFYKRTKQN